MHFDSLRIFESRESDSATAEVGFTVSYLESNNRARREIQIKWNPRLHIRAISGDKY